MRLVSIIKQKAPIETSTPYNVRNLLEYSFDSCLFTRAKGLQNSEFDFIVLLQIHSRRN